MCVHSQLKEWMVWFENQLLITSSRRHRCYQWPNGFTSRYHVHIAFHLLLTLNQLLIIL